jgi:hypothetical protein
VILTPWSWALLLGNQMVYYRVYNFTPLAPLPNQTYPFSPISSLYIIIVIIVIIMFLVVSFWLFLQQSIYIPPVSYPCHILLPSRPILFNVNILIIHGEEYKLWSSCHFVSPWPKYSPQLSVLKRSQNLAAHIPLGWRTPKMGRWSANWPSGSASPNQGPLLRIILSQVFQSQPCNVLPQESSSCYPGITFAVFHVTCGNHVVSPDVESYVHHLVHALLS